MPLFSETNLLLPIPGARAAYGPSLTMEDWSVIACDQFTSQPDYWEETRRLVGDHPSTLNLILPETELNSPREQQEIGQIHVTMDEYMGAGIFQLYEGALIYVERTLQDGRVRKGLVGKLDLEAYDYHPDSTSPIRATEKTVVERIPARMRVRDGASLEVSHTLVLCDDDQKMLIEPLAGKKEALPKLYDFDLMQDGGHITGYLVQGEEAKAFAKRFEQYMAEAEKKYPELAGAPGKAPVVLAVGDGNHSLATAKACYEDLKKEHPDENMTDSSERYALVELTNIHDDAVDFEPIHRIVTGVNVQDLLQALQESCCVETGASHSVAWYAGETSGTLLLDASESPLAVEILQNFLDAYLEEHPGRLDYIHGEETLRQLAAKPDTIGFELPKTDKAALFPGVIKDGSLPRKTFSMGHATDKRYYLEAREI